MGKVVDTAQKASGPTALIAVAATAVAQFYLVQPATQGPVPVAGPPAPAVARAQDEHVVELRLAVQQLQNDVAQLRKDLKRQREDFDALKERYDARHRRKY